MNDVRCSIEVLLKKFNSPDRMMPKRSDHYLSLVQGPNEPIKDAFKQTIVSQENMFRKQVQELHRAYQMQMFMMKNSRSKEMAETQYSNYTQDNYRVNWSQRPPNCELPAGIYANYKNEHFVHKGNGWGTQEKPIDVECYFQGDTESCTEDLNLSLNNGKKSLEEKVTPASSPHIIDLEESTGIVFNQEHGPPKTEFIGAAGCSSHFGNQTCLPGISSSTKRSLSFLDVITNHREKSSLNQDYEDLEDLPVSVGKTSTSCKVALLDLNEPPCDEPSFNLNDDTSTVRVFEENMSPDSSSSIKPNDLLQQHTPTSILTAFNSSTDNSTNDGSSNMSLVDLESCGKPKSENSEDQECLTSSDSQQKEGELGLKLESINSKTDIDMSRVDSLENGSEGLELDDALVRRGAVSLLYFMNYSISEANECYKVEKDEPERSLDSFESAMLKLKETKVDDYNDVSSNGYEAKDNVNEKDCPVKLRRGRRMKDFQKDILPSMTTLSRHEICEDVRLMEGVIRSREYKRLKSKMSSEQNWFTPVKSRRSRLNNNIGRKCYN